MQNLMDLEYGWASLDNSFIFKIVQILSSPQSLINVCRPATAILKKLVEADPVSAPPVGAPGQASAGSSRQPAATPESVYRYGFAVVFEQMRKEKALLETVVSRLGSADTAMALYRYESCFCMPYNVVFKVPCISMMLINSLLSHASDERWEEFIGELERLNVRKAVVVRSTYLARFAMSLITFLQRLMSSHTIEDLTSCILDFQANIVRVTYRRKTTPVDPGRDLSQAATLDFIWNAAKLEEEMDNKGTTLKWRKLGFDTENVGHDFGDVGVLGLDCLVGIFQ
jgi:engulfment/cell motility protein 1